MTDRTLFDTPYSKINLACGQQRMQGFVGVDIQPGPNVDIVHDLTKYPWPIESGSVSEVFCSHYIEHVPMLCMCCASQPDPLFRFFDELYRILKTPQNKDGHPWVREMGIPAAVDGKVRILAPYYSSVRCWQDPTHRRAISEFTFFYAVADWRKANSLDHYPIRCDFDFAYGLMSHPDVVNRSEQTRAHWMRHYMNVVTDIDVTMVKRI